jgi:hypothetical protein
LTAGEREGLISARTVLGTRKMSVLLGAASAFVAAYGVRTVFEADTELEVAIGMALIAAAACTILIGMRRKMT